MAFVKICGITNLEDALAAVDAGADAVGFNFYRSSPRYIWPSVARTIVDKLSGDVVTVGVFVNEDTPEAVEQIALEAGVAALQLHGDESPGFCAALAHHYIIKVLPMGPEFNPLTALSYNVPAFMVDTFDSKVRGGTGRTVDWSEARHVRSLVPKLFLAGGLSPENVAEAISTVTPYGVDACSALELAPGKKDPKRITAFVKAVRAAVKP